MKKSTPLIDSLFARVGIGQTTNEQTWDSLQGLYQGIGESIVGTGEQVNECVRMIMSQGLQQDTELSVAVKGLTRDLTAYSETLIQISLRHKTEDGHFRTGNVINADELTDVISIYESYAAVHDRMRANTLPIILTITDRLAASSRLAAAEIEEQKQYDINVITDVKVKE